MVRPRASAACTSAWRCRVLFARWPWAGGWIAGAVSGWLAPSRRQERCRAAARPTAQGQGDRAQRLAQPGRAPCVAAGQPGDLLGEGDPRARVVLAEEPADLQVD